MRAAGLPPEPFWERADRFPNGLSEHFFAAVNLEHHISRGLHMSQSAANVHSVHFYGRDTTMIDRLCGVVCSGLLVGNAVLIVAIPEHRKRLVQCLERLGVGVRKHTREGKFSMIDAEELMATFMVNDSPHPKLFLATVGTLIADAKKSARSHEQALTVFGEMVALLWQEGNRSGALALEKLWNDLLNDRAFHLHCAYPQCLVENDDEGMRSITEVHSHVVDHSVMTV